jgi:hypothetical protein
MVRRLHRFRLSRAPRRHPRRDGSKRVLAGPIKGIEAAVANREVKPSCNFSFRRHFLFKQSIRPDAASTLEMMYVTKFAPTINIQRPYAEPLPRIGLGPDAFISAMTFPADDRIDSARRSVSNNFLNEMWNHLRYIDWFYAVTHNAAFWEWWKNTELATKHS